MKTKNSIKYKKRKFKPYQFNGEEPCFLCHNEPVSVESRKLGKTCYYKLRKKKSLPPKPKLPIHRRQKTVRTNMAEKYGEEILADFELLRTKPFWNQTEISKKYGFSKERARQMYNMLYGKDYTEIGKAKTKKIKKENKYCKNDPRYKVAEYKEGSYNKRGAEAELMFYKACKDRDYRVELLCDYAIDIKVNGLLVEIKSNYLLQKTSKHSRLYGRFIVSKHQHENADVIVCYHATIDTFYIIPIAIVPKCRIIYIAVKPSTHYNATNRYEPYKEAWHLLETNSFNAYSTIET